MNNKLYQLLLPSNALRIYYNSGNPNNRFIYIRALVDNYYVVFRWWNQHCQYWMYQIEPMRYFETLYADGHLSLVTETLVAAGEMEVH